ncbi:hypothetical protein NPIL_536221 [Nephila pilipes]|uniref:Uncharacterized protein n=1 Tax=Nephila pilipes TaxID=299642 RepID=A0A8X6M9Q4_NEPPI|nr:hypothetical protein NPIL_536221 [Nephila pilipes]
MFFCLECCHIFPIFFYAALLLAEKTGYTCCRLLYTHREHTNAAAAAYLLLAGWHNRPALQRRGYLHFAAHIKAQPPPLSKPRTGKGCSAAFRLLCSGGAQFLWFSQKFSQDMY